jgi:actin related protein 2/3 complex, subunit 1A/1B
MGPKIDAGKRKEVSGNSARNKFMQMDSRSQATDTEVGLNTTHQNTITSARAYKSSGNAVTQVSTSGVDGQLVIWDLMSAGIANLRL